MTEYGKSMPLEAGTPIMEPLKILREAILAVPAVRFALGAAGIAAAGALITKILGHDKASIIIIGGTFISMVLLYIFATMVTSKNGAAIIPGIILLYTAIFFFCSFLVFTVTAFSVQWPSAWASFIGVLPSTPPSEASQIQGTGLKSELYQVPDVGNRTSDELVVRPTEENRPYDPRTRRTP